MATNLYEQEIDKTVDWAGDASTGNLAVSGEYVQKFIKDALNKKFGYLYYSRTAVKYYLFADEDDYNAWEADPTANADKKLFEFNAPAPASITFSNQSRQQVTILKSATGNYISFNYKCLDSSNSPIAEAVTVKISITCNGASTSASEVKQVDFDSYATADGTLYRKDITSMLSVGTNIVSVTVTGNSTGASTTLSWSYNVVDLGLTLSFDNSNAISLSKNTFTVGYTTTGGGTAQKYLEIYIDSQRKEQGGIRQSDYVSGSNVFNSGSLMNGVGSFNGEVELYLYKDNGDVVFEAGLHTLQARCYIVTEDGTKLYSDTTYTQFVIVDPESTSDVIYILTNQTISGAADAIFAANQVLTGEAVQYEQMKSPINYCVYSSTGSTITINFNVYKVTYELGEAAEGEEAPIIEKLELIESLPRAGSSTAAEFNRQFNDAEFDGGDTAIYKISATNADAANSLEVLVTVTKSGDVSINEKTTFLKAKFSALNRSNDEPTATRSKWVYGEGASAISASFINVPWDKQTGWIDNTLTLVNGAQVSIPLNLFDSTNAVSSGCLGDTGMTFELDFETFNSQDDDSVVMEFKSENETLNKSFIKITATSATIQTNTGKNITTNFKDNERQKIAFIVNGKKSVAGSVYPNLMLIMVNGVLDRVIDVSDADTFNWSRESLTTESNFVIGNPSGEVGVKIHSIRIYSTALTLDEELENYIYDSADIVNEYKDNAVINVASASDGAAAGKDIDITEVRKKCRTMVIYGDIDKLENETKKGHNYEFDIEYWDPVDNNRSFFCRNGFLSCQGTSSMQYPQKNLRFYLNKKYSKDDSESKQSFGSAANENKDTRHTVDRTYQTEMYPYGWYNVDGTGASVNIGDPANLGKENANGKRDGIPFSVNSKTATNKVGYHRIDKCQAKVIAETSDEYLYTTGSSGYVPCQYGDITNQMDYFISAYRPVDYDYAVKLRRAKFKVYTRSIKTTTNEDGETVNVLQTPYSSSDTNEYVTYIYSECKKSKPMDSKKQYYCLGNTWSQSGKIAAGKYIKANPNEQGLTDRWTLKTDYAESSMTHNGGIGRFWGECMKNVQIGEEHAGYGCRTIAQENASQQDNWWDIRTSCFGLPMVVFTASMTINEDGSREYGAPKFLAQFNWMTDKGSTPLFGFENLYNENGEKVYGNEDDTFCFEGSVNGSELIAGKSVVFDKEPTAADRADKDQQAYIALGSNAKYYFTGEKRPLWGQYEQRWPDPDIACNLDTYFLESFVRWMAFFKPAVNYTIDGIEGYNFNPYSALTFDEAKIQKAAGKVLYAKFFDDSLGEYAYAKEGTEYTDGNTGVTVSAEDNTFNENDSTAEWYIYNTNIDYENVSKSLNNNAIGSDIYIGRVPGYDANVRFYQALEKYESLSEAQQKGWDDSDDYYGTYLIPGDDLKTNNIEKYYVDVYLTKKGQKYYYTNEFGNEVEYTGSVAADEYEVNPDTNRSWKFNTYIEYFKKSKWDHLSVYKVAAYYVYFIRFAGVDQVIKNTMTTTEDRQHFYFINYDNDTTCGVRNDGVLVFNWDVDRDSFDTTSGSNGSYAFAGAGSVFWNTLEMDEEFMQIVKNVDNALYSGGLLTYNTVTEVMNDQFVHYWCPRLYNKQEYIKYLNPFYTADNTKYLNFLHGTRESHRSWWLRNRFDLYDSKWQTGEYMQYKWKWLVNLGETSGASSSNRVPIVSITAASKYYFCCQENNEMDSDDWFVQLRAGEFKTFKTPKPLTIGDPMQLVGPQKVKSINFRPGNIYLLSIMNIVESVGKDENGNARTWITDKGTLLTQFLIGDGDPKRQVALTSISGLNSLSALEELDLRYCINLPALSIDALNNLHIYRAYGSGCSTFVPASSTTFYEVSLPDGTTTKTDGTKNTLSTIELNSVKFTANPAEYVEASAYMAQTADETGITLYKKRKDTGEYEEDLYNQNFFYSETDPTYDGKYYVRYSTDLFPVWTYKPDANLSKLTLNGVSSDSDANGNKYFDDVKFIQDWLKAIKTYVTTTTGVTVGAAKNYSLTIKDVNWTGVPVAMLLNGITDTTPGILGVSVGGFSGNVTIEGTGTNGVLTKEEYEALVEVYGLDVFTSATSALKFNAKEGMFFQSDSNIELKTTAANNVGGIDVNLAEFNSADKAYYKVVRGSKDSYRATIFPAQEGRKLEYRLDYYNATDKKWVQGTRTVSEDGSTITYSLVQGVKIVSKNNIGTLETSADYTSNTLIRLAVQDITSGTATNISATKNSYIYVAIVAVIVPGAKGINISGETSIKPTIDTVNNEYEYTITFDKGANNLDMNVGVKTLNVVSSSTYATIVGKPTCDNETKTYGFKVKYSMPEVTSGTSKAEPVTFTVTAVYDTTGDKSSQNTAIVTIYPVAFTSINVAKIEDETTTPITGHTIEISTVGEAKYKVSFGPASYNIPIVSVDYSNDNNALTNNIITVKDYDETGFTIDVANNFKNGTYESFNSTLQLIITAKDKFNNTKVLEYNIHAAIVYPEELLITHKDYENNSNTLVTNTDMYLRNGQGTSGAIDALLIGENAIINGTQKRAMIFNIAARPKQYSTLSEVTIPYKIEIENAITITASGEIENGKEPTSEIITSTDHGQNSFAIYVPVINNSIVKSTITFTAKCTFDNDGNAANITASEILRKTFTINIERTLAAATTKTQLKAIAGNSGVTNTFIVDSKCNYYKVTDWGIAINKDRSLVPIGVCYYNTAQDHAFAVGLTDLYSGSTYKDDAVIKTPWWTTEELITGYITKLGLSAVNNTDESGYSQTTKFIKYLTDEKVTAGLSNSAIYLAYHSLDKISNLNTTPYLPSVAEIRTYYKNIEDGANSINGVMSTMVDLGTGNGDTKSIGDLIGWKNMYTAAADAERWYWVSTIGKDTKIQTWRYRYDVSGNSGITSERIYSNYSPDVTAKVRPWINLK